VVLDGVEEGSVGVRKFDTEQWMVESIRWREGEETVESIEGEVTLEVERRESNFETGLGEGVSREGEGAGEGGIEDGL
jgi:hypothetical protein